MCRAKRQLKSSALTSCGLLNAEGAEKQTPDLLPLLGDVEGFCKKHHFFFFRHHISVGWKHSGSQPKCLETLSGRHGNAVIAGAPGNLQKVPTGTFPNWEGKESMPSYTPLTDLFLALYPMSYHLPSVLRTESLAVLSLSSYI